MPTFKDVVPPAVGQTITISEGKLNVPDNPIIPFIEGDGTGPDIWRASVRVFDAAVLAEEQRDLGVALDPADVFNSDSLFRHGYAPNLVAWLNSGLRPARSSVSTKKMASAEGGHPCTKTSTSTTSCTGRTFVSSLGITSAGIC